MPYHAIPCRTMAYHGVPWRRKKNKQNRGKRAVSSDHNKSFRARVHENINYRSSRQHDVSTNHNIIIYKNQNWCRAHPVSRTYEFDSGPKQKVLEATTEPSGTCFQVDTNIETTWKWSPSDQETIFVFSRFHKNAPNVQPNNVLPLTGSKNTGTQVFRMRQVTNSNDLR